MNIVGKIIFWIFTIAVGFVNPLISFGLIIFYYLPGIIQELCQTCKESDDTVEYTEYTYRETRKYRPDQPAPKMDSFSEETIEDMK